MHTEDTTNTIGELKTLGNAAYSNGRYEEAIKHFTEAITLEPTNHIFYSNRSASYASLREYEAALKDAEKTIELNPEWAKGHGRKGAALAGMGDFEEARDAYARALELEPDNVQMKKGLEAVMHQVLAKKAGKSPTEGKTSQVDNPFADPSLLQKLGKDPKMAPHLTDPQFLSILAELQKDPKNLMKYTNDQRVMQAFMSMLGVDTSAMSRPANTASGAEAKAKEDVNKPKEEERHAESESHPQQQEQALKEKELGNAAYKRRDFEGAISHYDAAIALDPENVSLLTNKSAVFYEQGKYEECIALCTEAVEKGRQLYADFKVIAKALGRIGSCHEQLGDLQTAITFYSKSLTEHRTPDILGKQKAAEKALGERAKAAYHNPQLAEEARNKGNELFKEGNYVEALKYYSEAIKRDENDPRGYSNRAACYTKLAAVPEGLKDCEKAIQLDASFVKAYIRKANLLIMKRDFSDAMAALDVAKSHDGDRKHSAEISQISAKCFEELRKQNASSSSNQEESTPEETLKKAMQNPEIREIMQDPVMNQILQQMQSDPRAAMEHLKNPIVSEKIRKLIAAGIIRTQ